MDIIHASGTVQLYGCGLVSVQLEGQFLRLGEVIDEPGEGTAMNLYHFCTRMEGEAPAPLN